MRSAYCLALVGIVSACGLGLRLVAPSPEPAPIQETRGTDVRGTFLTTTGDVEGVLVEVPGCRVPVAVATFPDYLTGVRPDDVTWGHGPHETAYAYAGRPVPAWLAQPAAFAGRMAHLLASGVALGSRWPGLEKAMADPACPGAAIRALTR